MATAFATFGDANVGVGGLSASIGGTAAADDWLTVTTAGIDGDGLGDVAITDDEGGATGWEQVTDFTSSEGISSFRTTTWRKLCVGGETMVSAAWAGASNVSFVGAWLSGPTQADLYVLGQGLATWDGTHNVFTCSNAPSSDNESYVGVLANGRTTLTEGDIVSPPGETAGLFEPLNGFVHTLLYYNNDEAANSTADVLAFQSQPEADCYIVFLAIGPPKVDVEGTGHLLIGGDVGIEATGGTAEVEGTGRLLIGGSIGFDQTGGDAVISGTGRVIGGGSVGLSAPAPFPPQPVVPSMTGQLGCGIYDVFIFTRGLGQIVGRIPFNQVTWTRILDDTSTAEITVNGVSNVGPMESCCALLGSIEPWKHELGIYRNGLREWSGPITKVSYPSETVIIDALDLSGWLTIRTLHENHNNNSAAGNNDLAEIWEEYVLDAMSVGNTAGLFATIQALTGVTADRLYTEDMHTFAADAIAELARTGLDWYCVDRRMIGGPVPVQPPAYPDAPPTPTLVDESFRDAPTVDRDGSLMANCWYVNGSGAGPGGNAIFGEYGPEFPATPDHVAQPAAPDYAAIEAQYDRIEQQVSETKILDQSSIDQNAATRYDLTKLPVDVISSGTLLPTAGIDIRQLIPGSVQNVHLTRACVQIGAPYRLKQLTVTAASDGSEDVEGAWEPLGSLAAHEDLV